MNDLPLFPKVMMTGHRDFTKEQLRWLKPEILKTMKRLVKFHGMEEAISGFALGADTFWADYALSLDVALAAYIPFEAQPATWPQHAQEHWSDLRKQASREVVLGDKYHVHFFHARNDAMINDSDLAVAAFRQSESRGGTFSAVNKLRKLEKPLIVLDPEMKTVTKENFPEI